MRGNMTIFQKSISFKHDENLGNFLVILGAHLSLTTNQEPSHVNAHDAKLVPFFLTQLRSQDPIDPLKSLTTFHVSPQMLYIAKPARYVRKSTLAKQGEDWRTAFANTYEM